jgi:hypothetical protein
MKKTKKASNEDLLKQIKILEEKLENQKIFVPYTPAVPYHLPYDHSHCTCFVCHPKYPYYQPYIPPYVVSSGGTSQAGEPYIKYLSVNNGGIM